MTKKVSMLGWMPVALPAVILILVYFAWTVAFIQLGRRPLPSMDDPKYIGGVATQVYAVVSAAIVVLFFGWLFGTVSVAIVGLLPKTLDRWRWWLKVVLGLSTMVLLVGLTRFSPGGACEWFLD
jgi:hypothetical protein